MSSGKSILLVEDESLTAIKETKQLERAGYGVVRVATGEAAVAAVASAPEAFDLVLMDIQLGAGIDGTEAARRILEIANLPIIFLSSHTERDIVEKAEQIESYGYVVKDSGDFVLDSSIRMALRLHEARRKLEANHDELRESESYYRRILEISHDGFFVVSDQGRYIDCNEECARMYGYSREELLAKTLNDIDAIEDPEETKVRMERIKKRGHELFETVHRRKDGEHLDVEVSTTYWPARRCYVGFFRDISERKRAEQKLRESEKILKKTQQVARLGYWRRNISERRIEIPRETALLFDLEEAKAGDDLTQQMMQRIHAEDRERMAGELVKAMRESRDTAVVFRIVGTDGVIRWLSAEAAEFVPGPDGQPEYMSGIVQDITVHKANEERIRSLLAERETFIREIHHRVKNNMNTVYSFLSYQAELETEERARQAILDAAGRVHSMGLLYEKLYRADFTGKVRVADYLSPLLDEILALHRGLIRVEPRKLSTAPSSPPRSSRPSASWSTNSRATR